MEQSDKEVAAKQYADGQFGMPCEDLCFDDTDTWNAYYYAFIAGMEYAEIIINNTQKQST